MAHNSMDTLSGGEVMIMKDVDNMFDFDFEDFIAPNGNGKSGESSTLSGGAGGMEWENEAGSAMLGAKMATSHEEPNEYSIHSSKNPFDLSVSDFSANFNTQPSAPTSHMTGLETGDFSSFLSPEFTPFTPYHSSSVLDLLGDPTSPLFGDVSSVEPFFATPHPLLGGSNFSTPADEPLPITPHSDAIRQPAIRSNSSGFGKGLLHSIPEARSEPFDFSDPIVGQNDFGAEWANASLFPSFTNKFGPVVPKASSSSAPIVPPVIETKAFSPSIPVLSPPTRNRRSPSVKPLSKTGSPYVRAPIDLNAPTQTRAYHTPSATSRKALPAFIDKKLAKYGSASTAAEIPEDIQDAIEKKRRANCVSARKLRQKKQQAVVEKERIVEQLREEVEAYKARAEQAQELLIQYRGW